MSIIYPNTSSNVTIINNVTVGGGSGSAPGGSDGSIQYNSGSSFAGTGSLSFNTSSNLVTVPSLKSNGIRAVSLSQDSGIPGISQYFTGSSGSMGPFTSTIWTVAGTGSSIVLDPVEPLLVTGSVVGQELWVLCVDSNTTITIPYSDTTTAFSGSQSIVLGLYDFVKFVALPTEENNYWLQTSPVLKLI